MRFFALFLMILCIFPDMALAKNITISGTLVTSDGTRLGGMRLIPYINGKPDNDYMAASDAETGKFKLNVPDTVNQIKIMVGPSAFNKQRQYALRQSFDYTLNSGDTKNLQIIWPSKTCAVNGVIIDQDKNPIANVMVCENDCATSNNKTQTDSAGQFKLNDCSAGNYVHYEHPNFKHLTSPVYNSKTDLCTSQNITVTLAPIAQQSAPEPEPAPTPEPEPSPAPTPELTCTAPRYVKNKRGTKCTDLVGTKCQASDTNAAKAKYVADPNDENGLICVIIHCSGNFMPNADGTACDATDGPCIPRDDERVEHATEYNQKNGKCLPSACDTENGYSLRKHQCVKSEQSSQTDNDEQSDDDNDDPTPSNSGTTTSKKSNASDDKKIQELRDKAKAAQDAELSTENKILGATAMATAGQGMADMMAGAAQQSADDAAERDMRAYIETFRCDYGAGRNIRGGEKAVQIPTTPELTAMVLEYKQIANDLKISKEALNMRPGIEAETIFDSATSGLYDNVSVGIKSGAFTSVYRALTDENSQDAADWAVQKADAKHRKNSGTTMALGGIGVGVAGNLLLNSEDKDTDKKQSDSNTTPTTQTQTPQTKQQTTPSTPDETPTPTPRQDTPTTTPTTTPTPDDPTTATQSRPNTTSDIYANESTEFKECATKTRRAIIADKNTQKTQRFLEILAQSNNDKDVAFQTYVTEKIESKCKKLKKQTPTTTSTQTASHTPTTQLEKLIAAQTTPQWAPPESIQPKISPSMDYPGTVDKNNQPAALDFAEKCIKNSGFATLESRGLADAPMVACFCEKCKSTNQDTSIAERVKFCQEKLQIPETSQFTGFWKNEYYYSACSVLLDKNLQ